MKRVPLMIIIISASLLLTSCVQTRYLEKQGLITAVGYDKSEEENKITGTVVFYQFNPSMKNLSTVLTGNADTSKGIRMSANMESDHNLISGQLRSAIYGQEIAKDGISSLVDSLTRDSSIGNMIFLAIADPTAEEILSFQPKSQPSNMGTYLYNLVQLNIKNESIPNPTLQEFLTNYGTIGKDAILPYLSIVEDRVGITGFALFIEDKMVGQLEREKIFYVRALRDRFKSGSLEVELPVEVFEKEIQKVDPENDIFKEEEEKGFHVTLDSIKSRYDIKVPDNAKPEFDIELKMELRLLEMTIPLNLSEGPVLKKLEKELEKAIEQKGLKVFNELQESGSDPIGFGTYYKAVRRNNPLTKKEWRETYPEAKFNFNVKVKVVRTGVID